MWRIYMRVCMQLAFRNARKSLLGVKLQVRHLLHMPEVLGLPLHAGGGGGGGGAPRTSSLDAAAAASDGVALDPALRELDDVISVYLRKTCLLYTSPSPRDRQKSRMPSSA